MQHLKTSYTLTARTDDHGLLGFVYDGVDIPEGELFAATMGNLLAHDLLEHVNGLDSIGTVADELQALGAVWYIRGQNHQISKRQHHSSTEILADDIMDQHRYEEYLGFGEAVPYDIQIDDRDLIAELLSLAKKSIRAKRQSDEYDPAQVRAFLSDAKYFIQQGINKAEDLFPCDCAALSLFYEISDAFDKHPEPDYEGQQFELVINTDDITAQVHEHYEFDEYEEEE